jgi:hypothetical protein
VNTLGKETCALACAVILLVQHSVGSGCTSSYFFYFFPNIIISIQIYKSKNIFKTQQFLKYNTLSAARRGCSVGDVAGTGASYRITHQEQRRRTEAARSSEFGGPAAALSVALLAARKTTTSTTPRLRRHCLHPVPRMLDRPALRRVALARSGRRRSPFSPRHEARRERCHARHGEGIGAVVIVGTASDGAAMTRQLVTDSEMCTVSLQTSCMHVEIQSSKM